MSKASKESEAIRDLARAFANLRSDARNEPCSLKDTVKYCSIARDDGKDIAKRVKEFRRDIQLPTNANNHLQTEHKRLVARVEEFEQYERTNNLEIKGVPVSGDP